MLNLAKQLENISNKVAEKQYKEAKANTRSVYLKVTGRCERAAHNGRYCYVFEYKIIDFWKPDLIKTLEEDGFIVETAESNKITIRW
jgi:hypothetical protein